MLQRKHCPPHQVKMKLGKGWHERNFLTEVVIPSFFTPRIPSATEKALPQLSKKEIGITWIGHASFLVQTANKSILIDPNWARWLKVIKRLRQPGLELHELPSINLVLVTHAHFDHLDKKSLRAVASDQPIVVPEHVGSLVKGLGFKKIHELTRWETLEYEDLKITLTPASHWGARMIHDHHRGFGGFLIEYENRTIFHCGDSAYFSGFVDIGKKASIDIALLPIGAYDTPTRRDVHMNPEEALQAFQELQAKVFIPMHYGSFRLGYEPLEEPPQRLLECAIQQGLQNKICILKEGESKIF